jgi:hypothetical protein
MTYSKLFSNIIKESIVLNEMDFSSVDYTKTGSDKKFLTDVTQYEFTVNGIEYVVILEYVFEGLTVSFHVKHSDDKFEQTINKYENLQKVLGTVFKIVIDVSKELLEKSPILRISFESKDFKRIQLYERIIDKYFLPEFKKELGLDDDNIKIEKFDSSIAFQINKLSVVKESELPEVEELLSQSGIDKDEVYNHLSYAKNDDEKRRYALRRLENMKNKPVLQNSFDSEMYRVVPGKATSRNIESWTKLRRGDSGYEIHLAPTERDAKKWIPILLRDEFLSTGYVTLIAVNIEGMEIIEDHWISDKTNTPNSFIGKTEKPQLDRNDIRVIETIKVTDKDVAPDLFQEAKKKVFTLDDHITIPSFWYRGTQQMPDGVNVKSTRNFAYYEGAKPKPIDDISLPEEIRTLYNDGKIERIYETYSSSHDLKIHKKYSGMSNFGFGIYFSDSLDWAQRYGNFITVAEMHPEYILAMDYSKREEEDSVAHRIMSYVYKKGGDSYAEQAKHFYRAVKSIDKTKRALFIVDGRNANAGQVVVFDPTMIYPKAVCEFYENDESSK